jgi:hypothetical protein
MRGAESWNASLEPIGDLKISRENSRRRVVEKREQNLLKAPSDKQQEGSEHADSPPLDTLDIASPSGQTIVPLPCLQSGNANHKHSTTDIYSVSVAFPFDTASRILSTASLLSHLPPRSDASTLVDCYYRPFSWQ